MQKRDGNDESKAIYVHDFSSNHIEINDKSNKVLHKAFLLEPLLKLSNDFDNIRLKNGPWGPLQICKQPVPHIFDFNMFIYTNYSSLPKYLTLAF